jgi:hypothetical protein
MSTATAWVLIAIIVLALGIAWWIYRQSGMWLIRRHLGVTCPVCHGMGSTEHEGVCRACQGRRYIWGE